MPVALRRMLVVAIVVLVAVGLVGLLAGLLGQGGWTVRSILLLACFAGTAPWIGLCVANGLLGFLILVGTRDPARAVVPSLRPDDPAPPLPAGRVALAVTIRSEDMDRVLPPLRALLDGLDAAGWGGAVGLFLLSDTPAGEDAAREEAAIAAFRAADPAPGRVRYRRRTDNAGFKAGNFMDFLDHHAEGFATALTLDADSKLSAAAAMRLVRALEAAPKLAILQHLTVGTPAGLALPRLFQFGMRAGMRSWAAGQGWWQDGDGPYWGHNAAVRIAAFRDHAKLPLLPDGGVILSHDQIEAALLCGAGWQVRVLPVEDGSAEDNPPALPEFLRRDQRWMAGNLQYRHLFRLPGLRPMGRWQLLQAILLFAGAPLHLACIILAAIGVAMGVRLPGLQVAALTLLWMGCLYLPKLLGYMQVLLSPCLRARYGGGAAFARGAVAEVCFTLLLDAVMGSAKTLGMIRLLLGARPGWLPQNRADRGVTWLEATRLLWPHTVLGVAIFAACWPSWGALLWAVPMAGGMVLGIPLCVWSASPRIGARLRALRLAAVPEELS